MTVSYTHLDVYKRQSIGLLVPVFNHCLLYLPSFYMLLLLFITITFFNSCAVSVFFLIVCSCSFILVISRVNT